MESLLSFFISDAHAQAAGAAGAASQFSLLLPIIFIGVIYFLMIRPQQKKQKEHRAMMDALVAGNEVVTGGGVLGKITAVGDQFVTVEVADGVAVKVQKHTISAVVPKDTIKNA
ncbi:MAG TPA: preprotein translocase subunit YajC [Gammaproteobacteria bacterium]|nr:preprotein translocase subunit YajC [Gammaproteobacteria bacterium]